MCFASRLQPNLVHHTFSAGQSSQGLALRVKEIDLQRNISAAEDISEEHVAQNSPCTIDEDLHQKFAGLMNKEMIAIITNISTDQNESRIVSGLIGTTQNHSDPSPLRCIEQEQPIFQTPAEAALEASSSAVTRTPEILELEPEILKPEVLKPDILDPVRRCILPPGQAILPPPRRFYGRRWHSVALAAAMGDRAARMARARAERARLEDAPPAPICARSSAAASG